MFYILNLWYNDEYHHFFKILKFKDSSLSGITNTFALLIFRISKIRIWVLIPVMEYTKKNIILLYYWWYFHFSIRFCSFVQKYQNINLFFKFTIRIKKKIGQFLLSTFKYKVKFPSQNTIIAVYVLNVRFIKMLDVQLMIQIYDCWKVFENSITIFVT